MKFKVSALARLCALASICVALAACASQARTTVGQTNSGNMATGSTAQTTMPTTPPAPASPTLAAPAEECSTADLAITLIRSGAAGGTVGAYLRFANVGRSACTLSGWPRVQAIGADESARDVRPPLVDIGIVPGIPVVALASGASALAGITAGDESVVGNSCPPPYHQLSVTPPHQHAAKIISAFAPVVGYLPSCSRMEVTMVVPTSDVSFYN